MTRTSHTIPVSHLISQPANAADVARLKARMPMLGSVPKGVTLIPRGDGLLYALRYTGWQEYVWLQDALAHDRRASTRKTGESLRQALDEYEAAAADVAA